MRQQPRKVTFNKNAGITDSRRALLRLAQRMTARGLSERHALRVMGMSASVLRCQPAPYRNGFPREATVAPPGTGVTGPA